jgi:hypothetical protein
MLQPGGVTERWMTAYIFSTAFKFVSYVQQQFCRGGRVWQRWRTGIVVIGLDRHRHNSIFMRHNSRTLCSISHNCKTYAYMFTHTVSITMHQRHEDIEKGRKYEGKTNNRSPSKRHPLQKDAGTMRVGSGLCYFLRHFGVMRHVLGTRALTYVPKTGIFRKVVLIYVS